MADKLGTLVTIRLSGCITVPPADIPPPASGWRNVAATLEKNLLEKGVVAEISAIHTFAVSRENPNKEAVLNDTIIKVLDREGNAMPDRQIDIIQHSGVTHPFALNVANSRKSPWHLYGYFRTIEDANRIGEAWQEGKLEIDLEQLPRDETSTAPIREPKFQEH